MPPLAVQLRLPSTVFPEISFPRAALPENSTLP
jgi:hypothetical protein